MFSFLRRVFFPVSDDTLSAEFDISKHERPFRCGNCSKMLPAGMQIVYVPDSASYFKGVNSRQEMAVLAQQNTHTMGWCIGCIRGLSDDGSIVRKEDHRPRWIAGNNVFSTTKDQEGRADGAPYVGIGGSGGIREWNIPDSVKTSFGSTNIGTSGGAKREGNKTIKSKEPS
jgi:hypothetical protein